MKKWLFWSLLLAQSWAHPLEWMVGNYHGQSEGSQLEETWTQTGRDLLGSTVWLEAGRVGLRELFRISPSKNGYHLDLWLTFSDGQGKHLSMEGRAEGPQRLVFLGAKGDRLTYVKRPNGGLRCELQKRQVTVFDMDPGVRPLQQVEPSGDYIVHTFLGDRVFADELHWGSTRAGSLTVPGKFTAQLEKVELQPDRLVSFEIVVPEGEKPYRVRYQMYFTPDMSQATGSLVNVSSGQTMGCFVALKKPVR
ncbi:hypothetical protein JST97_02135 [bacterium]|nr:hypothetical protein [bacterium]